MSLISDALKEAQRERSERASPADRATPSAAKTLFSSTKRSKKQWAIPVWAVIAGVVLVALTPLTVVLVRARMQRAAKNSAIASVAATTPATPRAPSTTTKAPPTTPVVRDSALRASASRPTEIVSQAVPTPKPSPAASHVEPHTEPRTQLRAPERTSAAVTRTPEPHSRPNTITNAQPAPATPAPIPTSGVRVILDPTNLRPSDSLFAQAYAEQTRGNGDRAAELYERALQLKPVSPQLYNDYGALLASRGNHTAAIAMYNLGLKSDDRDPRLWTNLGDSYKAIVRHADAMSAFAEAAKLDPLNPSLKTRLAGEYAAIGDTANARRGYEDAARLAPRDAAVHYAYGAFLQSQRDYRGAVREFQLFTDLAPGKFSSETIDAMKAHVARLAKLTS